MPKKQFHEIGAEMLGNSLLIRMENKKRKKKHDQWNPPCDCEVIEIKRPCGNEGPKIVNAGDANQIVFQIQPKSNNAKDDPNQKAQAIRYEVGSCRGGKYTNDQCRIITVDPQNGLGVQQVHTDHLTDGCKDVYLLRIKKPGDSQEPQTRNIELELHTPKPPEPPKPCPPQKTPIAVSKQTGTTKSTKSGKKGKKSKKKKKKK